MGRHRRRAVPPCCRDDSDCTLNDGVRDRGDSNAVSGWAGRDGSLVDLMSPLDPESPPPPAAPESLLPCPCFKLPPLCRYEQAVGGRGTVDGVASMINMDLPSYLSLLSVTGE